MAPRRRDRRYSRGRDSAQTNQTCSTRAILALNRLQEARDGRNRRDQIRFSLAGPVGSAVRVRRFWATTCSSSRSATRGPTPSTLARSGARPPAGTLRPSRTPTTRTPYFAAVRDGLQRGRLRRPTSDASAIVHRGSPVSADLHLRSDLFSAKCPSPVAAVFCTGFATTGRGPRPSPRRVDRLQRRHPRQPTTCARRSAQALPERRRAVTEAGSPSASPIRCSSHQERARRASTDSCGDRCEPPVRRFAG